MIGGNLVGGVVIGYLIGWIKCYKGLILLGVMMGCMCYLLFVFCWWGNIVWYEILVVVLGGMGMGIV